MKKHYSQEFKDEAVKLANSNGKSVRTTALELGVSYWSLRDWIDKAQKSPAKSKKALELTKDEKIRRLEKEVSRLRMEREILKKATAFFAKEQP
ncbi:MAG: hypothetical protein CMJ18_01595 [Phycisphaeraceae bacterium]|jgi:transposase|nr:hypothetical protein [Phycisphaeraceae bacterium]